jgi:hypothetical protein
MHFFLSTLKKSLKFSDSEERLVALENTQALKPTKLQIC